MNEDNVILSNLRLLLCDIIEPFQYTDEFLNLKLNSAAKEINRIRNYKSLKDDKMYKLIQVESDYEYIQLEMVIFSINKMGAEGQMSHKENNITRVWQSADAYPNSLLNKITPKVRVL